MAPVGARPYPGAAHLLGGLVPQLQVDALLHLHRPPPPAAPHWRGRVAGVRPWRRSRCREEEGSGHGITAGSRPAPRAAPAPSMAARTLRLHDMAHGAPSADHRPGQTAARHRQGQGGHSGDIGGPHGHRGQRGDLWGPWGQCGVFKDFGDSVGICGDNVGSSRTSGTSGGLKELGDSVGICGDMWGLRGLWGRCGDLKELRDV